MPERIWKQVSLCFWGGFDWSNLPEDIKVEILRRLPDTSLTMLKCVSKYWYFLISKACVPTVSPPSPFATFCGFIYTRRTRISFTEAGTNSLKFFPCGEYCDEYYPRLLLGQLGLLDLYPKVLPFEHRPEDIQDCCNGLLLLARFGSVPTEYYVCNPTTSECISIPINPCHVDGNDKESSFFASLAFDPSCNSPCNSFKIVRMPFRSGCHLKLDVFSSSKPGINGNWSTHILPLENALQGFGWIDRSIYLNGVLYLLSLAKFLVCIHLNIANMTCLAVELPEKDEFSCSGSLGVVRGSLVYSNSNKSKILVWVLEEDDGVRWKLLHKVITSELVKLPWIWGEIKVYGFDPKSGDLFVGTPSVVQRYNPKTKELRPRVDLPSNNVIVCGQYKMFPYSRCPIILNSVISSSTQSDLG